MVSRGGPNPAGVVETGGSPTTAGAGAFARGRAEVGTAMTWGDIVEPVGTHWHNSNVAGRNRAAES